MNEREKQEVKDMVMHGRVRTTLSFCKRCGGSVEDASFLEGGMCAGCRVAAELKRDSHGVPWEAAGARWTADECLDANGYITIRIADGSPNGDIHEQPIATVYDERHALTVAAAPELLEALELMIEAASETAPTALAMRIDKAAQHARQAIALAKGEVDMEKLQAATNAALNALTPFD